MDVQIGRCKELVGGSETQSPLITSPEQHRQKLVYQPAIANKPMQIKSKRFVRVHILSILDEYPAGVTVLRATKVQFGDIRKSGT